VTLTANDSLGAVLFGPLFMFFASGLSAWIMGAACLAGFGRTSREHWTVRAARLDPIRRTAAAAVIFVPLDAVLGMRHLAPSLSEAITWAWPAGVAGVLLANWAVFKKIDPALTWREASGSALFSLLGHRQVWVLTALGLWLIPASGQGSGLWAWGWATASFVMVASGVMDFLLLLVLRTGGWLTGADDRLLRIVEAAGGQSGVRARQTAVLKAATTFVWGITPGRWVIFSGRAANSISDEGLKALAAQRLAFFEEPTRWAWLRIAASGAPLLLLLARWDAADEGPAALYAAAPVLVAAAWVHRLALRRRETAADTAARRHEDHPLVLGETLERVYEANLTPAVVGVRRIGPELFDRMLASGLDPGFDRPKAPPPPIMAYLIVAAGALLLVLGGLNETSDLKEPKAAATAPGNPGPAAPAVSCPRKDA
jgi:hypothetical protein